MCNVFFDSVILKNDKPQYFREFNLILCKKCFHIQAESKFQFNEIYNQDYGYTPISSGVQQRFNILLQLILSKLEGIKFNRVIDIGCNQLNVLKLLKDSGISANHWIGIDPISLNDSIDKDNINFIAHIERVLNPCFLIYFH
jgi:hypothetical protein